MGDRESGAAVTTVIFRVQRYVPEDGAGSRVVEYRVPVAEGMTVLDGLIHVKERLDGSLSWRASCRMGICGSCGMWINGRPRLACQTQVAELGTGVVQVRPLPNFPVIRDLVPDLGSMIEKHRGIRPYLLRRDLDELERPTAEYVQTRADMERYVQFAYCIKCGCCMGACPTLATDVRYLGPQPLSQVHRYNADTRDDGFEERREVVSASAGVWRCHFAGECSEVCPKGVDPALAIQRVKRELVFHVLRLRRRPTPAPLAPPAAGLERRPGIPEPPPPTAGTL
jgi:succinate dehydrogenase / fumarate reductase iron-sulfur subunit